jgi:ATP-dependent protease HslVU (ClpYQ) peptidase subunit
MTTIVANLECMAADQRMTSGNAPARVRKIRRVGESLYAGAGNMVLIAVFFDWLEAPKKNVNEARLRLYRLIPEDQRYEFEVLELSPSGLALWDGWGARIPILDKFYGLGSGGMSAMQAMKRGLGPEEAISETFTLDECSGGTVECEYLLPPELRGKRKRG